MSENYILHVLPWVTIFTSLFFAVFMCWLIYYSYEGTKLQNPRKTQSVITMIFAIMLGIIFIILFIWACFHLSQLYKKKESGPMPATMTYPPIQQEAMVAQPRPVSNLNNFTSSSSITPENTSAANPANIGRSRVSYSGDVYDSPEEAVNIKNMMLS
jgi:amino acid transporter